VYEIEQSFPTAHADGLKVLGLFGATQRFVSLLQRSPAGCQWFNSQIVKRFSFIGILKHKPTWKVSAKSILGNCFCE
jgi:hypothetical protein